MQPRQIEERLLANSDLTIGELKLGAFVKGKYIKHDWEIRGIYNFLQEHPQITSFYWSFSLGINRYDAEVQATINLICGVTTLRKLTLIDDGSHYSDNSIARVTALGRNTSLTQLELPCNGIRNIDPLQTNSAITSLNLFNNGLNDDAAILLAAMLPNLINLDVGENPIFNLGFMALIAKESLCHLSAGIGTASLSSEKAEAIGRNTRLTSLILYYNVDENFNFEPLKQMPSLQSCLDGTWHSTMRKFNGLENHLEENRKNLRTRRGNIASILILLVLVRDQKNNSPGKFLNLPLDIIYMIFNFSYDTHLLTERESKQVVQDIFANKDELKIWLEKKKDEVNLQIRKRPSGVTLMFASVKPKSSQDQQLSMIHKH